MPTILFQPSRADTQRDFAEIEHTCGIAANHYGNSNVGWTQDEFVFPINSQKIER
ncbi:hypothetical protein NTGBS_1050004 [Candidatus Nitrotoga sp. BS]|uniref:hypothetical protein n=1 Tax=Candidatus Nitrotoga sp. BS TaxID=2890408 RepID=UPI001EF16328|nr:hypothetical protein [Candidatus Nitrotoga sp. BS]CAH1189554.1 hypothetical protein NTGBS_1050004 [Candidatus Nitrotoga sp. BS]